MIRFEESDIQNLVNKGTIKAKGFKKQEAGILVKKSKTKYNNKKVSVDNMIFDSQLEADYYNHLKLLLQAKEITTFAVKPKILLQPKTENSRAIWYEPDFVYSDKDWKIHYVDTKGIETDSFKLKKKMLSKLGINLEIIKKGDF